MNNAAPLSFRASSTQSIFCRSFQSRLGTEGKEISGVDERRDLLIYSDTLERIIREQTDGCMADDSAKFFTSSTE